MDIWVEGTVLRPDGQHAPSVRVFIYEGSDVENLRADLTTDEFGRFSLGLSPLVSFVHADAGQPLKQVFLSYRILAFGTNEADHREVLHEFRTFRILPGEVEKSTDWQLVLKPYPGEPVRHAHSAFSPSSGHLECYDVPCIYDEEDLGDQLTKVTELHTTAGLESRFEITVSTGFKMEMAIAWDGDWENVEYEEGATWSEQTSGWKRLLEAETEGTTVRSTFHYYRYWWQQTWCGQLYCETDYWETVEATHFHGGATTEGTLGGNNEQVSVVENSDWHKHWIDPNAGKAQKQETARYWANAVGFSVEGFSISLGSRIEVSVDHLYEYEFDVNDPPLYPSYQYALLYDRGTDMAIWYATHRIKGSALSAVDQTTSSIKLEWSPFEGLDFSRYEFYYRQQGSNTWSFHSAVTDVNQLSGWFGGLNSGTTYEFRMRVQENTGLVGDYSNEVERTTSSPPPPDDDEDPPCDPSWPACPTSVHGWAALGWATPPVSAAAASVAVGFALLGVVLERRLKSGTYRDRQRDP